ncbi:hypothetical protein [Actinokineospora pegani]|uniref:hypothetical protein n=1 Tax=Actinokineospora pegani TaxID=2654637 RepID=UPI0012EAA85B|nr:hypothetical protein [Actinokineospora pegani]
MDWRDRFYRVPHDLKHFEHEIDQLAKLMDGLVGGAAPAAVAAARDEVTRLSINVRARLAAQDRLGDLRRFRRRVLRSAEFMDRDLYEKVFVPYVETILPKTSAE